MPSKLSTNTLWIGTAVSIMLSGSVAPYAIADNSLEQQIMNGEAAPSTPTAPAASTVKIAPAPAPAPITAPQTTAAPSVPAAVASPADEAARAGTESRQEPTRVSPDDGYAKIEAERREREAHDRENRERESHKPTLQKESAVSASASPTSGQPARPKMLIGRIEQLAGSGAAFPTLKAMTAQVDKRNVQVIKGQTQIMNGALSGVVVQSFPTNYAGNWGGHIVMQQVQVDPNYYRVDAEEAARTVQAMHAGMTGDVNFMFDRSRGKINLEPSHCLFMVPASQTQVADQLKGMGGGGMMAGMMANMPVPLALQFGDIAQGGGETGVSGNQIRQVVLKNEVRELSQGTVEQDIVTQTTTWDKHTNKPRTGYGETVLRFSTQSPTVMYVQVATVNYGADKKFLCKMNLYGSIGKGVVMNTDPMSAMTSGMGGMGGLGGLGALQNMFNGGQGGHTQMQMPTQMPGMPGGGNPMEMLKNMFGGQ